jgi:hypothetical protein
MNRSLFLREHVGNTSRSWYRSGSLEFGLIPSTDVGEKSYLYRPLSFKNYLMELNIEALL